MEIHNLYNKLRVQQAALAFALVQADKLPCLRKHLYTNVPMEICASVTKQKHQIVTNKAFWQSNFSL